MKISVIIPVYNEAKTLRELIINGKIIEAKIKNKKLTEDLLKFKIISDEYHKRVVKLIDAKLAEKTEKSYIGQIGKKLSPIFKPLGFDWKLTTAVLAALPAKEVFVSQLAIINSLGDNPESEETLREKLRRTYTPLIGFCVMLWVLIATPCIATLAVTRQETGSWKWAFFQFAGLTLLAYCLTFMVYNIGRFVG
jgi:ferrous iron transport protein B